LHVAAGKGYIEVVGLLLEADASADGISLYQGTYRGTPLEVARRIGNEEIAQLLIEHGANE